MNGTAHRGIGFLASMNQISYIPEPEERQAIVFKALRELVQSDAFRRSARIIRFLEYVVLESLSSTPKLAERTIGIVVFDRAEDWDPKLDPIVRIEARRLREKLGQYYLSVATEQAVVMDLPKGGYRILFSVASSPSSRRAPHRTRKSRRRNSRNKIRLREIRT